MFTAIKKWKEERAEQRRQKRIAARVNRWMTRKKEWKEAGL